MKITAVNTYFVRPRWGFVEIVTDEGYTGWGEAVLERLLESSGMQRGTHFEIQKSYDTPQGRLRPDAVIHLPQNMSSIVDSKGSLTA